MKSLTETTEKTKAYKELIDLLQKNKNINYLGELKKTLMLLAENQLKLEKLDTFYDKDFSEVFKEKHKTKNSLIPIVLKVGSLLILSVKEPEKIEKRIDAISNDMEDISDKKLLKYTRKILAKAYKVGGFSLAFSDTTSLKKIKKKIEKSEKIKENYGLNFEIVKELENAEMDFLQCLITINAIHKKRDKIIKQKKAISRQNEKILDKINNLVIIYEEPNSPFLKQYLKFRGLTRENDKITNIRNYFISF